MDYKKTLSVKDFYFLNYVIFQTAQYLRVHNDFKTWTNEIQNKILKEHFKPFENNDKIEFSFFENEVLKLTKELI